MKSEAMEMFLQSWKIALRYRVSYTDREQEVGESRIVFVSVFLGEYQSLKSSFIIFNSLLINFVFLNLSPKFHVLKMVSFRAVFYSSILLGAMGVVPFPQNCWYLKMGACHD